MNTTRPQEPRIRELVQNSFDSFGVELSCRIRFSSTLSNGRVEDACEDNGSGIEKRGRFGRGFKEALCIAAQSPCGQRFTAAGIPSLTGPAS